MRAKAKEYFDVEVGPLLRSTEMNCKEWRITCTVVLQPLLQFKQNQTSVGDYLLENHIAFFGDFRPFIAAFYDAFSNFDSELSIYDFREVFNDEEADVFGDSTHTNEIGNRIVANNLLDLAIEELLSAD